jgi:hypothetical protein
MRIQGTVPIFAALCSNGLRHCRNADVGQVANLPELRQVANLPHVSRKADKGLS